MMVRLSFLAALVLLSTTFLASGVVAQGQRYATFYDAIAADSSHKLLLSAVDKNPAIKALLSDATQNVTAFVPTDTAFMQAAIKYGMISQLSGMMADTCMLRAVLSYHIVAPGMKLHRLKTLPKPRNTQLVINKLVNGATKPTTLQLAFKATDATLMNRVTGKSNGNVVITGGPTGASLVAPFNVHAGAGIMHNVNALLLPATNYAALQDMVGCGAGSSVTTE